MGTKQRLYSLSQLHHLEQKDLQVLLTDWLIISRLLFEPDEMVINGLEQPFEQIKLQQL